MKNIEVRAKISNNRLRHYEVAHELGISEFTFSVWLRTEMTAERKTFVLAAIERLHGAAGRDRGDG